MLEFIFGNKSAETVLLNVFHYSEVHASAIADGAGVALTPIKNQLERFEKSGVLISKSIGRSRVYLFNPKSPLTKPVQDMIRIVYESIPLMQRQKMFPTRRRPRIKGKPVL